MSPKKLMGLTVFFLLFFLVLILIDTVLLKEEEIVNSNLVSAEERIEYTSNLLPAEQKIEFNSSLVPAEEQIVFLTNLVPEEERILKVRKTTKKRKEEKTEYLGTYTLTAYCPCTECSGRWGYQTASGKRATEGRTVACNSIPLGTKILIEGFGIFMVEDTGGMGPTIIDIFFEDHTNDFLYKNVNIYKIP